MIFFDAIRTFVTYWFPTGTLSDEFLSWLVGFLALSIVYGFTAALLQLVSIRRQTLVRAYLILIGTWSLGYLLPLLPAGGVL